MGRPKRYDRLNYSITARTEWDETALAKRRSYMVKMLNKYQSATDVSDVLGLTRQRIDQIIKYFDIKRDVKYY
jgi:hypothetical protein